MEKENTKSESASRVCYEAMEAYARERIQNWLQGVLEVEVDEFLGRGKSVRSAGRDEVRAGYRNGYGKLRRVSLTSGTIEVRRPRLRNLADRFESRVLPLFKGTVKNLGNSRCRLL